MCAWPEELSIDMRRNKLQKFKENETFQHVFQPHASENLSQDFHLKGKWKSDYFKNDHPLVLELGCGRGEYTIGMHKQYPHKNHIGLDIKGARIWKGAKQVETENLQNVAFIRSRVEFLERFFALEEVDEIWITFADPQPKKEEKRLTSPRFLNHYRHVLKPQGIIHLKTDSDILFDYTLEQVAQFSYALLEKIPDVYAQKPFFSQEKQDLLSIKTHYESIFSPIHTIKYLSFKLV